MHRAAPACAMPIAVLLALPAMARTKAGDRDAAFSATRLVAPPRTGWPTNGGNVYKQRYSLLAEINRDIVAGHQGVWRTHLRGSGLGPQ